MAMCSVQSLKSILDAEEARRNRFDVLTNHKAIDEFCNAGKQENKFMIVAFDKGSGRPAAMALLKTKGYDATHLKPLPEHPIKTDMKTTSSKLYWELSYCIRKADQHSKCLGDICLSCGIEEEEMPTPELKTT
ncbi:hypothetical protein OS493_032145 [Desmophyllum pertusum]|uniref:Uncharacterized protein n=1 Tax=Desmophyllum pertusum TaxID=174260 RepID=A0A9W9Y8C1_9CNID|nr:hypothetical protein OS493_032145 [Desmophyllum pertusum]